MSTEQLSAVDLAIIDELKMRWRAEIADAVEPIRKDLIAIAHRTSRLPGSVSVEHSAFENVESVGQQFARSDELKALLSAPGQRRNARQITSVGSLFAPRDQKTITSANIVSPTVRLPGIVPQPRRALRLRDLIPVRPYDVPAGSVDYLRQSPRTTPAGPQVLEGDIKSEVQIATSLRSLSQTFSTNFATPDDLLSKARLQSMMDVPDSFVEAS